MFAIYIYIYYLFTAYKKIINYIYIGGYIIFHGLLHKFESASQGARISIIF